MVMWVGGISKPEFLMLDGGAHAIPALAHSGVGKADRMEVIFVGPDAGEVHLDVDHVRVNAVDRSAEGFEMHKVLGRKVAGVYTRERRALAHKPPHAARLR